MPVDRPRPARRPVPPARRARARTAIATCVALSLAGLAGCAAVSRQASMDTRFGDADLRTWQCADGTRVEVQPLPASLPELAGPASRVGATGQANASSATAGAPIRLRAGPAGTPIHTLLAVAASATMGDVERWRSADGTLEWFGRRGGTMTLRDPSAARLLARDCSLEKR